jgi:hypothetical protein
MLGNDLLDRRYVFFCISYKMVRVESLLGLLRLDTHDVYVFLGNAITY